MPVFARLWGALLLLATVAFPALSAQSPPTVDPSYGLPIPKAAKPAAWWIWASSVSDNQTVLLRRSFHMPSVPSSAILFITADDYFTLYVNGSLADRSVPSAANGNVWQTVHRINLSPYLRAGWNTLAVQAVNAGGPAGVVAQLNVGDKTALCTDASWKVAPGASSPRNWMQPEFDDRRWIQATVIAPVSGGVWADSGGLNGWPDYSDEPYLAHLDLPVAKVLDIAPGGGRIEGEKGLPGDASAVLTVWPAKSSTAAPPSVLLDFGKELSGAVRIEPLTAGVVQVGTGESREEAEISPWHGIHSLDLAPGVEASTPNSAFRFARLTFPASASRQSPVRVRVSTDFLYYPVTYKGSFSCSDPLLTRIWYTGAYTAHLCMQQDIWDAPKRDRARWSGDLNVSGGVIDDVFADRFLMEQTLARLRDDAQGGRPADQMPASDINGIPGYSAAWLCTMADLYRHVGDESFVRKEHAAILSLLKYDAAEFDSRTIFVNPGNAWTFVDWAPDYGAQSPTAYAATDLFFVRAFREGAFLVRAAGDTANADKWERWAGQAATAARAYLADPLTGTYGSRLQGNAMAIYAGVTTPAQTKAIYAKVLQLSSPSWDHTGVPPNNNGVITPYYGNYVLQALSVAGHTAQAEQWVRQYWGGMLAEGATTFWEAYDPYWPKKDFHAYLQADGSRGYFVSLCHGWSSGPTSWLTERVLGIRPTSGGFRTVSIAPDLGTLKWAHGVVPTPNGPIRLWVDALPHGLEAHLVLPAGETATISLPGQTLLRSGKPIKINKFVDGRVEVTINSPGAYLFTSLD